MAWILLCKSCQFGDKMYYNYWDINFIIRDCFLLVHPVMWYFIASGKLLSLGLGSPIERRISSGDELHTNKWAKESQNCVKGNSPILYHNVSIVHCRQVYFPVSLCWSILVKWPNDQWRLHKWGHHHICMAWLWAFTHILQNMGCGEESNGWILKLQHTSNCS